MKICPFCAEEIQPTASKCKHCGEFLDTADVRLAEKKLPWYLHKSFIVFAFLAIGPLALPLIWWHPHMSLSWKIGLTAGILALSWLLFQATLESLDVLQEYFRLLDEL